MSRAKLTPTVRVGSYELKVSAGVARHEICKIKYPGALLRLEKNSSPCSRRSDDSAGKILDKHAAKHSLIISSGEACVVQEHESAKERLLPNDFRSISARWKRTLFILCFVSV